MTDEQKYRDKVIAGYTSQPSLLLSRLICRLFWNVDDEDYGHHVKEFVKDTTTLVGKENIEDLCDEIAKLILERRKNGTTNNTE